MGIVLLVWNKRLVLLRNITGYFFLREAVLCSKTNILEGGGSRGSGKVTFTNLLISKPDHRREIAVSQYDSNFEFISQTSPEKFPELSLLYILHLVFLKKSDKNWNLFLKRETIWCKNLTGQSRWLPKSNDQILQLSVKQEIIPLEISVKSLICSCPGDGDINSEISVSQIIWSSIEWSQLLHQWQGRVAYSL